MQYVITARCWDGFLPERFGEYGSVHELSDTDVIALIIEIGRAEITEAQLVGDPYRRLHFNNEYD